MNRLGSGKIIINVWRILAMTVLLFLLLRNNNASSSKIVARRGGRSLPAFLSPRIFAEKRIGGHRFYPSDGRPLSTIQRHDNDANNAAPATLLRRHFHRQQGLYFSSTSASTRTRTTAASNSESIEIVEQQQEEIYQELKWLSSEIRRHDELYYNNDNNNNKQGGSNHNNLGETTMITDDDYDALVRREEEICKQYPNLQKKWEQESGLGIKATRTGGRVGIDAAAPVSTPRFQKRKHLTPMLSLDNVTNKSQLYAWLERIRKKLIVDTKRKEMEQEEANGNHIVDPITIVTEPKLDGLSLSLRYQIQRQGDKGNEAPFYQLVWASTRGDGKQGQDVTRPVQEGMKLPSTLQLNREYAGESDDALFLPNLIEVRGEVVLPNSIFEELKLQYLKQETNNADGTNASSTSSAAPLRSFSNARNAASGFLLRKYEETNSDEQAETLRLQSKLSFYAYDMVVDNGQTDLIWTNEALVSRQWLREWGFQVPEPIAETNLELKLNDTFVEGDNATFSEYETWTEDDIRPMLEYHQALEKHRNAEFIGDTKAKKNPKLDTNRFDFAWGDYDMDGCVHKVSQASVRSLLGNSNRAPRWAVAHKFPSQSAITSLLDIEIRVGSKTGALTPVAVLEPLEMAGGVTVTRATLHNFQHMHQILLYGSTAGTATGINGDRIDDKAATAETLQKNREHHLLAAGTTVLVRRAGDVIPQIVQLAEPPKTRTLSSEAKNTSVDLSWIDLSAPLACPACGSPVVVDTLSRSAANRGKSYRDDRSTLDTNTGQVLRCGGPPLLCPPRAVGALVHAYSRDALDVSGLSEAKIQQLMSMQEGTVDEDSKEVSTYNVRLRFPSDIFSIAKDPIALEAIAELPGWGPKSAQNLANAANKVASEGVSLARFIYSLSIRFAGVHSSKLIATAYGSVTAFLDAVEECSQMNINITSNGTALQEDEQGVPEQPFGVLADKENEVNKGIGPALLSSLVAFSREQELVQAAKNLAEVIIVHDDEDFREGHGDIGSSNEPTESKPLQGMKVVFTGSLSSLNLTRSDGQRLAKKLGAKSTPSSISKATDLIVVGEKGGGKKLDNARELGIRIMEADEFFNLVENNTSLGNNEIS